MEILNDRKYSPKHTWAKLDGEYVKRCSFRFDLKCFFMTFIKVLKRYGVVEGKAQSKTAKQTNQ